MAFLIGGALGASLSLLLAPASGKEARSKLRDAAEDSLEKGRRFVESRKEILEKAVEAGRDAMEKERERLAQRDKEENLVA